MEQLGIDAGTRVRLIEALKEQIDVGRLPAGTGLSTCRSPAGKLLGLGCRERVDRYIFIDLLRDEPISSTEVEVPVRQVVEKAAGTVSTSVAQALPHVGDGITLTLSYADIFQWDVDLLIDPRPGDRVGLVYRVNRLDELPPDMPPLSGSRGETGDRIGEGVIRCFRIEFRLAGAQHADAEDLPEEPAELPACQQRLQRRQEAPDHQEDLDPLRG